MKTKALLSIFFAIIAASVISACSPVDRVISQEKPLALSFINKNGELVIINARTGEVLPSCEERAKAKMKPCKGPTVNDLTDLVKNYSGKNYKSVLSPDSKVEVIGESTITIIRFKGSECVKVWDWLKARWKIICD